MSVSKKKLINYLNHFKVSELREITKYMGQNVTKQNGGYYNKPQMIYFKSPIFINIKVRTKRSDLLIIRLWRHNKKHTKT